MKVLALFQFFFFLYAKTYNYSKLNRNKKNAKRQVTNP